MEPVNNYLSTKLHLSSVSTRSTSCCLVIMASLIGVLFSLLCVLHLSSVSAFDYNFTCDEEKSVHLTKRPEVELTKLHVDLSSDNELTHVLPRAGDHDLTVGDCVLADVYDKYNFTDCTYPTLGNTTSYYRVRYNGHVEIYCIRIFDRVVNEEGEDTGGYPFVDDGGIGFDFVELRFVSQEGEGMKWLVEIYTRVLENTRPPSTSAKSA